MITLNGKRFVRNQKEFLHTLFTAGGTAVGYYKVLKNRVNIYNLQKIKVGVVTKNKVLASCRKYEGKWYYSYRHIDIVGEYQNYMDYANDVDAVYNDYLR